jgi:hypothetical protein
VIRIGRLLKVTPVTAEACDRHARVPLMNNIRVTVLAIERRVPAQQGKARRLMPLDHICNFP